MRLIAIELSDSPEDGLFLEVSYRQNSGFDVATDCLRGRPSDGTRQIGNVYGGSGNHRAAMLKAVLQFANLPGPIKGEQSFHGVVAQFMRST